MRLNTGHLHLLIIISTTDGIDSIDFITVKTR